jgi:hypothetical protein
MVHYRLKVECEFDVFGGLGFGLRVQKTISTVLFSTLNRRAWVF